MRSLKISFVYFGMSLRKRGLRNHDVIVFCRFVKVMQEVVHEEQGAYEDFLFVMIAFVKKKGISTPNLSSEEWT